MAKFHINPKTGNAGICKSTQGKCPFGGDENHFTSQEAARAAFEAQQTISATPVKVQRPEYYVSDKEDIATMLHESGFDTTEADLVSIDSYLKDAYSKGYDNGVDVEMGSGRSTPFDSNYAAYELLQTLSAESDFKDYPEIATALEDCLERNWDSGNRNGGWDS